jgi:hypothetical protein
MARAPRAWHAGIYHVGSHGSDERHLFRSDAERELFLDGVGEVLERFELGLVSYTLMGNHYHLLQDGRVSKALQQLHTWYSRLHNKLNARSAHLFRAHFFARELEGDDDLLWTARYVAWNPSLPASQPTRWLGGGAARRRPPASCRRASTSSSASSRARSAAGSAGASATAPSSSRSTRTSCRPATRSYKADARTRTGDPFITSEVLYQLSYVGETRSLARKPPSQLRVSRTMRPPPPPPSRTAQSSTSASSSANAGLGPTRK